MTLDEQHPDLLIVGGGPAGMCAARTAAATGLRVLLVDERPTLGGQIYKQPGPGFRLTGAAFGDRQAREGRELVASVLASEAVVQLRTAVVAVEPVPDGGFAVTLLPDGERAVTVRTPRLVVAPGAHDRPVAFPGWTLPGVVTAGGLQTLAKTQWVLPTGRVVFAGSGPVALAFPAQLAHYGAHIVTALESGPRPRGRDIARIAAAARGNTNLLLDAARYRSLLVRHRVPLCYRSIVVRAEGDGRVERVVHARVDEQWRVVPGTERTVDADVLCIGYGFVPSLELFRLIGCGFDFDEDLGGFTVRKDEWGRTNVDGVYAAGDGTGVEGSYVAADEGELAALGAAHDAGVLTAADAERRGAAARHRIRRRRVFAGAIRPLYRVGAGIFELAQPDTIVCRCEVVTQARIDDAVRATDDINVVKALTRAGMGPCQGKNCQRHIGAVISRTHGRPTADVPLATPRMPVRPVPVAALADADVPDPGLFVVEPT